MKAMRQTHPPLVAALYDGAVHNRVAGRVFGQILWGADARLLYDGIDELGALARGSAVLDVPCGGGLAFVGLPADHSLDYTAADLSPVMLERARAHASRRGLGGIRYLRASVTELPIVSGAIDVCLTYNGLHCFPDPAAAVAEMARTLRPGGTICGTTVVVGRGRRYDAAVAVFRRLGIFGPGGGLDELGGWLARADITDVAIDCSGALARFTGRKSG